MPIKKRGDKEENSDGEVLKKIEEPLNTKNAPGRKIEEEKVKSKKHASEKSQVSEMKRKTTLCLACNGHIQCGMKTAYRGTCYRKLKKIIFQDWRLGYCHSSTQTGRGGLVPRRCLFMVCGSKR